MIFITGCNGLIGSFIVRNLLAQNYKVKALRRSFSDLSLIKDIEHKIEWVEGDVCDISLLQESLKGVETVIHTAAIVSFSPSDKDLIFKTNVEGTRTIVDASLNAGVKNFLHISSIAALGRNKNTSHINETVIWENSSHNTNYAVSKYLSELEVWRGMEEGLNVTIVNPSIVLGPGNWDEGSSKIFQYVWNEGRFYTEKEMNFVDVRDVADIVMHLLNNEKAYGNRFILNAGKILYKDFFNKVAGKFTKRAPYMKASLWMGEIAWRLAALKTFLTGKKSLITKETVKLSQHNFFYDNSKIKNFLNFNFRPVDDTISWVCMELRKKYNV